MNTILIVDDEYLIADILGFALEDEGFLVEKASNGCKALETFGAPRDLSAAPVEEWLRLLGCVERLSSWLQAQGWTVADLVLMTRGVDDIPPSPEISNLIKEMQAAIANAPFPKAAEGEAPLEPDTDDYLRALSSLIA